MEVITPILNLPAVYVHKPELERLESKPVLTYSPHPLLPGMDRRVLFARFFPGESVQEYLVRSGIHAMMGNQPFVLTINGRRVPRELWRRCYPKPGTLINVCAIVRGGGGGDDSEDDGNKTGRTIGMIAVVVIAYWLFGPGGAIASSGWGAAAGFAGTVVLGNMVVNRMFPLPKLPNKDQAKDSPTYALDGGSNSIRRYEPMVKICGTNKIFPDFGAQPYTEFVGDDQIAYYIFDLGYNDVDISDMRIGETALSAYTGVITEISDSSGVLQSFPANVDSVEGGTLTSATGAVIRTTSVGVTGIAVEISGNLFQTTKRGDLAPNTIVIKIEARKVGDTNWTPIGFVSDEFVQAYRVAYGFFNSLFAKAQFAEQLANNPGSFTITNESRKPLRRTFRWAVELGQYDVRVTKVTADSTDQRVVADLLWTQLRSYQPDNADYTGRKRIALRITSSGQLSGHIQQFNCIVSAKTAVWQGLTNKSKIGQFMPTLFGMGWGTDDQYLQQATSNPAWWYLDAIRGRFVTKAPNNVGSFMPYLLSGPWGGTTKVYGAGQSDIRTDLENIKAFAAWCSSQGLTFNFIFDQQESVFSVLQTMALSGRGTPSWGTGKLGVVWDAPNQPVTAVFGMHNILPGTFEISYAMEDLADVIEGEFINPDLKWQKDFVRVQVPGTNTQNTVRRIDLKGRTSRTLAAEDTNLYAAQNAYRNRQYKWQTDWEGMPSSRGDVIQLSHDLSSLDYSGRFIDGGNEGSLKLSKQVPLYAAGAFIVIVKPDGSFGTYTVKGGTGSSDTLVPVSPLPFNPWSTGRFVPYDYRWHYGPSATPGKKLKIDSVKPVSDKLLEITGIDELDFFYTAKSNPYTFVPLTTVFGSLLIKTLNVTVDGVRAGTGYVSVVTVSWDVSGDYDHAEVRLALNGAPPTIIAKEERNRSTQFTVIDGTVIEVTVIVYSSLGILGKTDTKVVTQTINFAALGPPADVAQFSLSGDQFSWSLVGDVDVVGYQIRFFYGTSPSWDSSVALHDGLLTATPWTAPTMPVGFGPTSFLIKAVDAAGIVSVNPAIVVRDLGDLDVANVVIPFDLKSLGWKGVLIGGTIDGPTNHLLADSTTLEWNNNGSTGMWAASGAVAEWQIASYVQMTYEDYVAIPAELAGYRMLLDITAVGSPLSIEYRASSNDFLWDDDANMMWLKSKGPAVPSYMYLMAGMVWGDPEQEDIPAYMPYFLGQDFIYMWAPFPDYQPWIGPITASEMMYEFRITTGQGVVRGEIDTFSVLIDTPDLIQAANLVSVPTEGVRIPLTEPFRVVQTVNITLQHLFGAATSSKWLDKDLELGPLIKCFDTNNNPTAGTVNVLIQGY